VVAVPSTFLRRQDIGKNQRANPSRQYLLKLFEGSDLQTVQDECNNWLINLPELTGSWDPHLIDSEMFFYQATPPNPTERFVIKLTIYIEGQVGPSNLPVGF
jgi:hypothetical protein